MGLRTKMSRACPTLKELDATLLALKTMVNELKADHNAFVTAATAKINTLTTNQNNLRAKYALHLSATHPDSTNVLSGSDATAISTTDNKTSSADVSYE